LFGTIFSTAFPHLLPILPPPHFHSILGGLDLLDSTKVAVFHMQDCNPIIHLASDREIKTLRINREEHVDGK
jgi:hypothetical protein